VYMGMSANVCSWMVVGCESNGGCNSILPTFGGSGSSVADQGGVIIVHPLTLLAIIGGAIHV